jgi:hypothetical protein
MAKLSRYSCVAAFGAAFAMLGAATAPVRADQAITNFGPVGPGEPILVTLGNQRIVAFYAPERGGCAVNAVVWKDEGADAPYGSARVRISLKPGQTVQLDGAQRQSMSLLCGADAATLAAVAPAELILTGTLGNQ